MKKTTLVITVMILALPILVIAQEDAGTRRAPSIMERIQRAADLIRTSREAREAGIPEGEVAEVLRGARERGITPEETSEILAESTVAVEDFGPVDNFGSFVQAKLDEGLRGRELAAAIHEEHRQRGKGKGYGKLKMNEGKHKDPNKSQEIRRVQGAQGNNGDEDAEKHDANQNEGRGKSGEKGKGK